VASDSDCRRQPDAFSIARYGKAHRIGVVERLRQPDLPSPQASNHPSPTIFVSVQIRNRA
jgi:hypothetical protein